jgi:mgtE-like transporter
MTHAGGSSFSQSLRENFVAYLFDIGGLLAGFLVAYQLGVFQIAPWAIGLYPAILGAKSVIEGLLSGRLSTALHLGTMYPRFSKNTSSFYSLIEAVVVLTLITSVVMSAFSLIFGTLFWGISFADLPAILAVVIATMTLGLALILVTVKVAFVSFKQGLDPDIMVYPIMSVVASVFITFCYVVVLNLFFNGGLVGVSTLIVLGALNALFLVYTLSRNWHKPDFVKTIHESLAALMIVAVVVNLTGTFLKGISHFANTRLEFYIVYPALIGLVSDVGSVVGSTATTKLALGMLKPKLSSIGRHAKSILSAWFASIVMFLILTVAALTINGTLTLTAFYNYAVILLVANVIAVALIILLSYSISILTFQNGLDPGNFVIPIETAFASSITSVALLIALILFSSTLGL